MQVGIHTNLCKKLAIWENLLKLLELSEAKIKLPKLFQITDNLPQEGGCKYLRSLFEWATETNETVPPPPHPIIGILKKLSIVYPLNFVKGGGYLLCVGKRSMTKNYCFISLLYILCKLFEKLVKNRLFDNLKKW